MRVENVWEGKKLSNINKETSQEYIKAIEIFRKCKSSGKSAMQKDVNLLDVMQLLENAHTNVLWEILKYEDSNGNHLFFESFIRDFLHLNINFNSAAVFAENTDSGTQYKALSNDKKGKDSNGKGMQNNDRRGFIDLLIKDNENVIIIENKVRGAEDGDHQLARYYYTFSHTLGEGDVPFRDSYKTLWTEERINSLNGVKVYIVYLSQDDSAEPSENTLEGLDKTIRDGIIKVNYLDENDGLISWLKTFVMPYINYLESGILQQSVRLYIDYWENIITNVNKYSKELLDQFLKMNMKELFSLLFEDFVSYEKEDAERSVWISEFHDFIKFVINTKWHEMFAKAPELSQWNVFVTPGYIKLFKKEWQENRYGIHFEANRYLTAKRVEWQLHLESRSLYANYQNILEKSEYKDNYIDKGNTHCYIWRKNAIPPSSEEVHFWELEEDKFIEYFKQLSESQEINKVLIEVESFLNEIRQLAH